MCRGLALGYDTEQNKMICKGNSSHTETMGEREDVCVKLEVIVDTESDAGFRTELDNDKDTLKKWSGGKYVTNAYMMTPHLAGIVERWEKRNRATILKHLLTLQSYAEIGEMYQSGAKIGEMYQVGAEVGKVDQVGAEIGKVYQGCAKIGMVDQDCAKIGEHYITHAKYTQDAGLTALIKECSYKNESLSLPDLVRWVAKHPEEAKKILGIQKQLDGGK